MAPTVEIMELKADLLEHVANHRPLTPVVAAVANADAPALVSSYDCIGCKGH